MYTTKTGVTFGRYYGQAVVASTGQTAPRVQSMAYRSGSTTSGTILAGYTYSYDGDGNIKQITDMSTGKVIATYGYDSQNQLTDEYLYKADGTANGHYQYSYDTAGNLQRVSVDSTIPVAVYKYGSSQWVDMLTEYEGKKIAYEGQTYNSTANTVTGTAISGNPINWYNGTAYTGLTWKNGRQLASIRKGTATYTYTYDMNGIRSSKTVNGVRHNYITQNGKVVREEYGTTVLEFVYDTNGAPYALRYSSDSGKNWMTYYYVLNLQGDVVKLLYANGTVRAEYTYNAWGEILSATNPSTSTVNIQDINPLRYRGYYYDTETEFYYLQSRYYDPVVKRFINADGYASTGQGIIGCNMFVYCNNHPTEQSDDGGSRPTYATMVTDTGSQGYDIEPRQITRKFFKTWTKYINKDIVNYGTPYSSVSLYYKGSGEITSETRRADMLQEKLDSFTLSALAACGFGMFGVGVKKVYDASKCTSGIMSDVLEYINPTNPKSNGTYQYFTLFIDTPCVMDGKACTQTIVIDYSWTQLETAYNETLLLEDIGVFYH